MMIVIPYDPKRHDGLPIYEMQTVTDGEVDAFVFVKVSEEQQKCADETPWYYWVDLDKEK